MSVNVQKQFKLAGGVDAYNPPVTDEQLFFLYLNNVEPAMGRLLSSLGYTQRQELNGELIVSFGFYQLSNRQFYNLYAFTQTKVYWFDFELEEFNLTPAYSGFLTSEDPYVIIPWFDCLYVTKIGNPFVKLERKLATVIDDAPGARYGILANSHVYLAGISDTISKYLARVRWSDLDAPESFVVNPANSEADFFDLEAESRQVTGVSYQRGSPITYTENCIWLATPIGFPGGFRHDPLFPGVGNIFHHAVIRANEVDYFIGADNFYALNGLQLVPLGTPLFKRFIDDVVITSDTSVRGYLDTRKSQVFWVYASRSHVRWSVVYNYLEKTWSERDPQALTAWMDSPRTALRGYKAIDDDSRVIDTANDIIDDPNAGFPVILPQLVGTTVVAEVGSQKLKLNGGAFEQKVESFDFYFQNFIDVKEVNRVDIEYTGGGAPNLTLRIGRRKNQSQLISWSEEKTIVNQDGSLSFFVRADGVSKYLRFRFSWGNTEADYITDLLLLSITKVEDDDDTKK